MAGSRTGLATSAPGTHEQLVERARALLPDLRARAAECEALRRVPDASVDALREQGLVDLMRPARLNGSELDYLALLDVVEEVATACASTAWVLTNLISCTLMAACFPPDAQDDVWGELPDALLAGSLIFAGGVARPADGGYELAGRWPLVSGCCHADWLVLGALVEGADGSARYRMHLVPRSDSVVHDTWDAAGLRGTGSHDVEVPGAFVPAHRSIAVDETKGGPSPGSAANPGWLYALPLFGLFATWIGGVLLGIARGAVEDAVRLTGERAGGSPPAPHLLALLGDAAAAVEAAGVVARAPVREAQAGAQAGAVASLERKLAWRAQGALAAQLCLRAVDLAYQAGGSAALSERGPLARRFRDAHAGMAHVTQRLDVIGPLYAAELLGQPCALEVI